MVNVKAAAARSSKLEFAVAPKLGSFRESPLISHGQCIHFSYLTLLTLNAKIRFYLASKQSKEPESSLDTPLEAHSKWRLSVLLWFLAK